MKLTLRLLAAAKKSAYIAGLDAAIEAVIKAIPRAHTYASENADVYYAWDEARDTAVKAIREMKQKGKP